jgi:phosphoribosyl 1,2-cyclic phosphodiesterase
MQLASLGSGSRGNATVLRAGNHQVMVDCGFSLSSLETRARSRGLSLATLDAILVTHEHGDHSSGVAALSRRYRIPVYLTHGTYASGRFEGCHATHCFDADSEFDIGELRVRAIAVPHDAREPVQFRFTHGAATVGVLTDLGSVTPHVCQAFRGCDLLLLEFNHDREMLARGPYPAALQRRVGGDWGHLSNAQALDLLLRLDFERLRYLVVAHISEKNNRRDLVEAQLRERAPSLLSRTVWATQDGGFAWLDARPGDGQRAAGV